MKKYLLTALLGVFGFVGAFASAETFTSSNDGYSPSSFTIDESIDLTVDSISNFDCPDSTRCSLYIGDVCQIDYNGVDFTIFGETDDICHISSGTYTVIYEDSPFSSISIDLPVISEGGDSSGTLLPNGTDDLEGIVNGLKSTMAEFIPYVSYIGIGIIVACLGFVAIRRLVNWVRAKIFDNF